MPATKKQLAAYVAERKAQEAGKGEPSAAKKRADKARAALLASANRPPIGDTPF
jgi:hypothetical protein